MEQRSEAWYEFRKKHIGASEVPIIMGTSDFMSIHDLWLIKTGKKEPFKGNYATQRGIDAEPVIKKMYESVYTFGSVMEAPVMEYKEWPILSASLDGLNNISGCVVEFKYPSLEKHKQALRGVIPATYRDQLQAQMLVSGYYTADYVSYDGSNICVVEVFADLDRQKKILEECKSFWTLVENNIEPPKAYVQQDGDGLRYLADVYRNALRDKERAEIILEDTKKQICDLIKDDKATFFGFTFTRGQRKGNIDYGKIPELFEVDLEQYRKPDSTVITIKEEK